MFGVCRGLQIMAHYFGYKVTACTGHAGTRHEVSIDGEEHTVNSYHDNCGPLEINPPLIPYPLPETIRTVLKASITRTNL